MIVGGIQRLPFALDHLETAYIVIPNLTGPLGLGCDEVLEAVPCLIERQEELTMSEAKAVNSQDSIS